MDQPTSRNEHSQSATFPPCDPMSTLHLSSDTGQETILRLLVPSSVLILAPHVDSAPIGEIAKVGEATLALTGHDLEHDLALRNVLGLWWNTDNAVTDRRFDLALANDLSRCVTHETARRLVERLCRVSDVVVVGDEPLLSGEALPSLWPEDWAALFSEQGYSCFDVFGRQPALASLRGGQVRDTFVFGRKGGEQAATLDPWNADGLLLTQIDPSVALSLLIRAYPTRALEIGEARQRLADAIGILRGPAQQDLVVPNAAWRRRLEDELSFARNMLSVEREGGMRIGERRGWLKGHETGVNQGYAQMAQEQQALMADLAAAEQSLQNVQSQLGDYRRCYMIFAASQFARNRRRSWFNRLSKGRGRKQLSRDIVEIKSSRMFDEPYYLACYQDVAASGRDAVEHYIVHGAAEGRNPAPTFNTVSYLAAHPDAVYLGINPLLHAIRTECSALTDPIDG